jgi:hypothetical protein
MNFGKSMTGRRESAKDGMELDELEGWDELE